MYSHLTHILFSFLLHSDTLYVQNNALTGDWPSEFCESGDKNINAFGLDCDKVECSSSCCGILQCYYSKSF